jgi:DNA-binding response OmpR family regulator
MRTPDSLVLAGSETILVAEDDKKLRTLAEIILKQHGYHVILAEDGEDAISKFMTHKDEIHLVILDMIMPKKSGIQVDNEIKKIKPDIKSFFASGYTADKIAGTDTCDKELELIMKPWSPKALLRKVREVLNKK